jgi:hypothetical protein
LDDVHLIDTDLDRVPTKFEITFDEGGNYDFNDDVTAKNIVAKGTIDGIPDFLRIPATE